MSAETNDPISLYLGVMKRSLVNWYYGDQVTREIESWSWRRRLIKSVLARHGFRAVEPAPIPKEILTEGRGICEEAYTLLGLKRFDNIEYCVRDVLEKGVPGDLLEAGVWKGGACIFMRAILEGIRRARPPGVGRGLLQGPRHAQRREVPGRRDGDPPRA
jgi:hypothetical protein